MTKTLAAQVTDTNGRAAGSFLVTIDFDRNGPSTVMHRGECFVFTGKAGTHIATGTATREMATDSDARLWVALDGSTIWED